MILELKLDINDHSEDIYIFSLQISVTNVTNLLHGGRV